MATTTRPFGAIQKAGEETWRSAVDLTPKQLTRLKRLMRARLKEASAESKTSRGPGARSVTKARS
jgi:hypothetical protein